MNNINFSYLRPKKAEHLIEWYNMNFYEKERLEVWSGTNAVILPLIRYNEDDLLFGRGGVVNSSGDYVELSKINQRVDLSYPYEDAEYRDEKVVYLGYLVNHWGHFLVEAVSRLWYFLENDISVDKYVFFIESNTNRQISGNYREFLELLGVWDKLEIINKPTKYREVIVPELGYKWRTHYSKKFLNIFETICNNVQFDKNECFPDKIFLSRNELRQAKNLEFGLDSIDDFYRSNGYEILFPEKISLSRLISYIRNSKVCASMSGSLPHNMLFANDNQELVIVERLVLNNEIQVDINRMKKFHVSYVDANIPIYTVNMSGPFIVVFNDLMQQYAKDKNMQFPNNRFLGEKYLKKCFKLYMKAYKKEYGFQWYMLDWYTQYADYLFEAYQAGFLCFRDYLTRTKPFLLCHYFELHYLKSFIKRIIKR